MSHQDQKSVVQKIFFNLRIFFRRFPIFPYILKWSFLSTLIGISAGTASAAFLESLNWITSYRESHLWIIAFLPVSGFAIGLLYYYYGKNVEAGNNLLIETIQKPGNIIPFRMAPFVYIGTMATHLFGGSAGREGTALQMAGAIADQFSIPLKLTADERKILIICAIAAGFGSVFGTPLAGAIFGLEVALIGQLKYDGIFPAFTSAIIANAVTTLWHVHHTAYYISVIPPVSFTTIVYAIIAGVFFALCATSFTRSLHFVNKFFKSIISFAPFRPLTGGAIVALAVWGLGTTKFIGLGIPTISISFHQHLPAYDFVLKMAFTIITLAAGFKGGEVTPLFFIGAALGNALSLFIPLPTGLLAGMGFVAVFAGATNTPLACTIMALELFGTECGVYAAIACIVAYVLSGHNSIYGNQMIGLPKHKRFINYINKQFKDL